MRNPFCFSAKAGGITDPPTGGGEHAHRGKRSGQGSDRPLPTPKFCPRSIRQGINPEGSKSNAGQPSFGSDHPIWAGAIHDRLQQLQHCPHRRDALRLVQHRNVLSRQASRDLLLDYRVTNKPLEGNSAVARALVKGKLPEGSRGRATQHPDRYRAEAQDCEGQLSATAGKQIGVSWLFRSRAL